MDKEIERAYRDHMFAHRAIGRLAVELSSAADIVSALTIPERATVRRAAAELSDVLKTVMDREDRLRRTIYGGSHEDRTPHI